MNFNDTSVLMDLINLSTHYLPPDTHKALMDIKLNQCENEIETVFHLTESHASSLRITTESKVSDFFADGDQKTSGFTCTNNNVDLDKFISKIKAMPKEWTVVQLTSQHNPMDNLNLSSKNISTSSLFISVINCGNNTAPFYVLIESPTHPVSKENLEILNEIHNFTEKNADILRNGRNNDYETYKKNLNDNINKLRSLILDTQNLWLKHWRYLFVGKLVKEELEEKIKTELAEFLQNELPNTVIPEKTISILLCAIKSMGCIKVNELKEMIIYCFPNCHFLKKCFAFFKSLFDRYSLKKEKRNPIILILDDCLDTIPWEMIDVLQNEPVSRLPSFHFLYSLFKEYQNDIKNGYKMISDVNKGTYIVNPDEDLRKMEIRMMNFLNYWCSEWTGISGYKPSNDECYELITSSEIFLYSGHGNGNHLMATESLQKARIKAVVLLFGCSSVKTEQLGSEVGYYAKYYSYLIAKSPCVVGMLWEVTDIDTDKLTTNFLSHWIPSDAEIHWQHVDKTNWERSDEIVKFSLDKTLVTGKISLEPDLLRALTIAKKKMKYFNNKAACVARGLPVKYVNS